MEQQYTRNTAYKLRIGDLFKGNQVINNDKLNYLEIKDKNIVRVNIIANVIEKFQSEGEKNYLSLTIDDASGQIRLKAFGEDVNKFKDIGQGDTVLVIGNLKTYNNELYILPEIIKKYDPRYLLVRKLELQEKTEGKPPGNVKEKIMEMIKKGENNGGIDAERIVLELKDVSPEIINKEIQKLLETGVIYEPRPGKLRFLG